LIDIIEELSGSQSSCSEGWWSRWEEPYNTIWTLSTFTVD